jgi:hypothetical protein
MNPDIHQDELSPIQFESSAQRISKLLGLIRAPFEGESSHASIQILQLLAEIGADGQYSVLKFMDEPFEKPLTTHGRYLLFLIQNDYIIRQPSVENNDVDTYFLTQSSIKILDQVIQSIENLFTSTTVLTWE